MRGRSLAELAAGAVVLVAAALFLGYALLHSGRAGSMIGGDAITLRARFDRIDGLAPGADVRIAGVKVGSVVESRIDPRTFLAVLTGQLLATNVPPWESGLIATGLAVVGFLVSLALPPAPPVADRVPIQLNPITSSIEVLKVAQEGRGERHRIRRQLGEAACAKEGQHRHDVVRQEMGVIRRHARREIHASPEQK